MHNKEQQQAILYGAGPLLVLAGPGSGKTYVITHRIIHLISECRIPPNQILVITFTKAAALEMQKRAISLYTPCSYVQFGTFHSVFYQILKQSNPNKKYQFASDKERMEWIKNVLNTGYLKEHSTDILQETENCMKAISLFKNNVFFMDEKEQLCNTYKLPEVYKTVYDAYEEWLHDNEKLDFDDMIKLCYEQLKTDTKMRTYWQNRFSHILIDEFQDINRIQYETIKLLCNNHPVFSVGDDDQAIYAFRGADPNLMKKFVSDFHAKIICLTKNYRSNKEIVDMASVFIRHNTERFFKEIHAQKTGGKSVWFAGAKSKEEACEILKNEVLSYQKTEASKKQAILTRTNGLAYAYQSIMEEKNTDRMLCSDIVAYLEFINQGQKRSDFLKIMNKPVRYISPGLLTEPTIDFAKLKSRLNNKPWIAARVVELEHQVQYAKKLDLAGQARYVMKAMGYEQYYIEQLKTKNPFLSQKYKEIFHDFLNEIKQCRDLNILKEEYEKKNQHKALAGNLEIMTYHASKGLEFDRVYLPDLEYGRVPHGRMLTNEELEEERRMFYVALTRAKESLWLLWDKSQTRSPFLDELFEGQIRPPKKIK